MHKLRNESKLDIWIYQIARNAIIDHYRHRGRVINCCNNNNDGKQLLDEIGIKEVSADIKGGVLTCIRPMIEDLPKKYSEALILTEFEGLTQMELAERLGLSLSGAKSRVQRARQKLKESLISCCKFEFDSLGNVLDYHQVKEYCCAECKNLKIKNTDNYLK
jgi:RNA polymerase sigma-70 factor (ECF subfamily)